MKKFFILILFLLTGLCGCFLEASARTYRQHPARIVNPKPYVRHYSHYRMLRGRTRRCEGSCHREDDKKYAAYTYSPAKSEPIYASGAYGVKIKRKTNVKRMRVYRYPQLKKTQPVTYSYSPIRTD